MTYVAAKWIRGLAIFAVVVGYPVLAHYSTTASTTSATQALGVAVALAPSLAILVWLGRRSLPGTWFFTAGLAVAMLLWALWPTLTQNFTWLYFIQHVGTNAALSLVFGQTLSAGQKPLISRLAESVRGQLSPVVARYTRQVTLAWTLFFSFVTLVSIVLFLFTPLETWSFFANFITLPLAIGFFTVEYLIRLVRLRHESGPGFLESIRAYWKVPAASEKTSVGGASSRKTQLDTPGSIH